MQVPAKRNVIFSVCIACHLLEEDDPVPTASVVINTLYLAAICQWRTRNVPFILNMRHWLGKM